MKKILTMDEKNYSDELPEIFRIAVRGIIFIDGRLLMIEDKLGEVKLPGGGMEDGEDNLQTLCRELRKKRDLPLYLIRSFLSVKLRKNACLLTRI